MLIVKILIVAVVLFLLRDRLAFLSPYWHVFFAFAVGAVAGWLMVSVLNVLQLDVQRDIGRLGCPAVLVRPLFALIGGMVAVGPISKVLRELLPYRRNEDNRDARR